MNNNICIIGLGYVGLPLAVMLATKGNRVFGIEKRTEVVEQLSAGIPHISEPMLPELLRATLKNNKLSIHHSIPHECYNSPTDYIITVGTPLDDKNRCRTDMIESATHEIATNLKDGDLVILRSTVKPGTTQSICKNILDETGKKYTLAFCPERIVEGQAISELTLIPTIIGSNSDEGLSRAARLFRHLTKDIIKVSSIEAAEVIKLINNMTRDLSFALSNEIGLICEEIGIDAGEVMAAATKGYDRTALPKVGLVGGPCLTKDIYLLDEGMEKSNFSPSLGLNARQMNDYIPEHGAKTIIEYCEHRFKREKQFNISFLGLAFKGRPATNDIRGTPVESILDKLKSNLSHYQIKGYDPEVSNEDAASLGIEKCETIADCFQEADIVIISNNHEVLDTLAFDEISHSMAKNGLIYDFWPQNRLRPAMLREDIVYLGFGEGTLVSKYRENS